MRIAVIADTHGKFPDSVAAALRGADEIWHLGDFCDAAVLDRVKAIGRPFYGILGNNDWNMDLPPRLLLERAGRTFLLIHIPPSRPGGADFLLHGHTHVPRDVNTGSIRVLNPGSVGKANRGAPSSWAWLDIDDTTGEVSWTLIPVVK